MSIFSEPTDNQSGREGTFVQRIPLAGGSWERGEQISACFPDSSVSRLANVSASLDTISPVGQAHEPLEEEPLLPVRSPA
jgi:hypothetical protein